MPLHGIQHTLLNTESRTAGILAATITVLLSLFSLPHVASLAELL